MKGSKRNKANIITAQIIPVPVEETSEVFLNLILLTRSLAVKEGVMRVQLEREGQHRLTMNTSPPSTHHLDLKRPAFVPTSMVHSILSPL